MGKRLLIFTFICITGFSARAKDNSLLDKGTYKVIHVVDGETIITSQGNSIKYEGLSTPPFGTTLGKKSLEINQDLMLGETIRIEIDKKARDRKNNIMAYVYMITKELDENRFGKPDGKIVTKKGSTYEIFINAYLLAKGYAKTAITPPNKKYMEWFFSLEEQARISKKGFFKEKFYW